MGATALGGRIAGWSASVLTVGDSTAQGVDGEDEPSMGFDRILEWSLRARGFVAKDIRLATGRVRYWAKVGRREGPPIVMVHGIGSSATHFHETLVRLGAQGHTLYAVDLPSHGGSEEMSGPCSATSLFGALDALLPKIVEMPFLIVGNSLGGALSVRYAWQHPQRVVGVVAASPALGIRDADAWDELKARLLLKSVDDAEVFVRRVFHRPPLGVRWLSRAFLRAMNRRGVNELIHSTTLSDFTPIDGVRRYDVPTLVIWGQSERLFDRKNLDGIRAMLPAHVRIEEPEAIGHCPHLDDPSWFARRVVDFLEEVRRTTPSARAV